MKKTVGDLLREARNKKGLALQEIERQTGIGTHHLLAIELDQFSLIDEQQFDTYLETYAKVVDLDVAELRSRYDVQKDELPEVEDDEETSYDELVLKTNPDYVPGSLGSRSSRHHVQKAKSKKKNQAKKASSLPLLVLSLIALGIVAFIGWTLFKQKDQLANVLPKTSQTTASSSVKASSSSAEKSTTSSSAAASSSAPSASEAGLAVTGSGDSLAVTVTGAEKPVKVEIAYTGEDSSWVGMTNSDLGDQGTILDAETPSHATTINPSATEALLSLGITKDVSIKIDGKELDMSALTSTSNSYITITIK